MKEIWASIRGYDDIAEVSNFGRVRTLDRINTNKDGITRLLKGKKY